MNKLSSKEYFNLVNTFAQTDLTYSDTALILENANQNNIKYYVDKEKNLFEEKDKKLEQIPCSKIMENYIENKKTENKNTFGFQNFLNENHISRLCQINSALKVGQNEYYYNIRKNDNFLKEKIENEYSKNNDEIWNNLTLKQKTAAIGNITSKNSLYNPSKIIKTLNTNPSILEKYLSKEEIADIKKIPNTNNPLKPLYNIIEKAYKEELQPSAFKIVKYYPEDITEINFTDNKEDGKNFLLENRKDENNLVFSELYDNKNNTLLFEASKDRYTDYESNVREGKITASEFSKLYNDDKNNLEKINDKASQTYLEYLEEHGKSLEWNNDGSLSLKDKKFRASTTVTLKQALEATKNIAKKEIEKTKEDNQIKAIFDYALKGEKILMANEGTLRDESVKNNMNSLINNNRESRKEFFELSDKIRKLQEEKNRLSVNNISHISENKTSPVLNYSQNQKLNSIEKKLTSGLSEKQINTILSETEKMADKFINMNNIKRSRKL